MFFLNCFDVLISKIKKKIILMYFQVKYILKINCYYNTKHFQVQRKLNLFDSSNVTVIIIIDHKSLRGKCITSLWLYHGVQSSVMFSPSLFKVYLVEVTGTLPSVSPLII